MVTEGGTSNKVNTLAVADWLIRLYGRTKGYVSIVSTSNWAGRAFPASSTDDMLKHVIELDNAGVKGIYARVSTLRHPPEEGQRGSEEDSFYLPGLWADMDLAGPGHKTTKQLPQTPEQCREILAEAKLPTPTLWVHSGGGLYPWWLFNEPVEIQDEADLKSYQDLSRGWHDAIAGAAERRGFHYGQLHDLARVLRIPGTVNRKVDGNPRPCMIVDDSIGSEFDLSEIQAAWGEAVDHLAASRPAPTPSPTRPTIAPVIGAGERPGDALAASKSWAEILEPAGFTLLRARGGQEYWVRPGKHPRDGHSVTTNYQGSDLMWVFSTEVAGTVGVRHWSFEPNTSYTKFATWSTVNGFGTDFRTAAIALSDEGYGTRIAMEHPTKEELLAFVTPPQGAPGVPPKTPGLGKKKLPGAERRDWTDTGNAERLIDRYRQNIRWVYDERVWAVYDEGRWRTNTGEAMAQCLARWSIEDAQLNEAPEYDDSRSTDRSGNPREDSEKDRFLAFIKKSKQAERLSGATKALRTYPEVHAGSQEFDSRTHLTNLPNGTLNSRTGEVRPHDPQDMLTRMFGTLYDPSADCPLWKSFMETNIPNPETRKYIMKLIGYTLTGRANEKLMVYMHGPSDTGKTIVAQTLLRLFGQYGYAAPKGTLAPRRDDKGHDPDRDGMAGKRFITTSESRPGEEMDEALIKALTGRDSQETRKNYADLHEWTPEGVIWVASNQYPKITGDDDAIWTRIKVVPFKEQFLAGDPRRDNNLQEKLLEELPGIFNWAIEGLKLYLEEGLETAPEVIQASNDFRAASDGVTTWLTESLEEGVLRESEQEGAEREKLYENYSQWCSAKQHRTPLKPQRFYDRLGTHYEAVKPHRGPRYFKGIVLTPAANRWLIAGGPIFDKRLRR